MHIKSLFFITCLFTTFFLSAQSDIRPEEKKKEPNWKDRFVLGGSGSLWLGTQTNINIAPSLGYKLSEKNILGMGISYTYYSDKRFIPVYQTSIYGFRLFDRHFITKEIFLQAEYEALNFESAISRRTWIGQQMIGAGYSTGSMYFMGLYILNYDATRSPYASPLILRVGFRI